jgi:hypothetical protein
MPIRHGGIFGNRAFAKGYPYENGSNTRDEGPAQARGAALLLCGDSRLSLIQL